MDLSESSLFASFFVSAIGAGFFIYGKKQLRPPQLVTGIALMVFPYCVSSAAWILAITAAALAALWLLVRAGL